MCNSFSYRQRIAGIIGQEKAPAYLFNTGAVENHKRLSFCDAKQHCPYGQAISLLSLFKPG
jgi:hypothetical protein